MSQNRDMLSDETLDELLEASTMDISTATGTDSKQRDVNVQERKQMSQAAYRLELISDHMLRSAFKPAMTRTPAFECSYSRMRHADDMVFKEGFEVERRVPLNGSSSSAQQRESGKDEEDEAFVFHCPWVDCHKVSRWFYISL
ncbi:hypothetical protein H2203_003729 [Taxawa tesnikishii (nom. ined.)]|nr:hypothetical protein H2203_003729 [Dothideales sp. JES 119]